MDDYSSFAKKIQLLHFCSECFGLVTAVPDTLGDGKGVSRVKRHLRNTGNQIKPQDY